MKIAIVSGVYYPMIDGVATFAHNLALGLAKDKNNEVIVICPSFTGKRHAEKKDGVTVFYLKSIRLPFYPDQINEVPPKKKLLGVKMPRMFYRKGFWVSLTPYREIKRILRKFKPDVIHSQTPEPIGVAASYYARKYDIPFVTTGHSYADQLTMQLKALKLIKKPLDAALTKYLVDYQRKSDYATMPTELAIEDLIMKRRKKFVAPIEALSNGVDLQDFRPGRAKAEIYKKYKLPTDRPIVLYVGRVDPEKSIARVVEAFAGVLERVPEAMLVVVGDGTEKERLKEQAKYLQIEKNIKFLGRVMPPELNEIYRTGELFATASEIETQGIVLIEAAATGLPIVAVDKGAVREVCVDGVNGVLCRPGGDIEGLREGMTKILLDKELRAKMAQESQKIAEKHDIAHTIQRFTEIYQKAIERRSIKDWAEEGLVE